MDDKYLSLRHVHEMAYEQAASGKGHERHSCGENFEDQLIVVLEGLYQSGNLFQAAKKMHESQRLPVERAIPELLGAINYLSARVIYLQRKAK